MTRANGRDLAGVHGSVISGCAAATSNGWRVKAASTGRAGSNAGSAARSREYSSQMPRKRP